MHSIGKVISTATNFVKRQKRNYRIAITRAALSEFLAKLTYQYDSIYTMALGANAVQLGFIMSVGNGVSSLISTPVGWLVDQYGLKKFWLLGIGLMAGTVLIYAVAPNWKAIIAAMILWWVSKRLMGTGCSVICADSLPNKDRSTGKNLCNTFSSVLSLIAPLVGAFLITESGGMSVEGIRPLYYIRLIGYSFIFLFVATQLREPERIKMSERKVKLGFIGDFKQLFEQSTDLKKWVVVSCLSLLPLAMIVPFLQVFAHQVKGANQYILGTMTIAMVVVRLLFSIPLGKLADRIGRKKIIYLLAPLWYTSSLLLVFSLNSITLVLAGGLFGFYFISSVVTDSMTLELVPIEQMGRWSGLLGLFGGLVTIPAPLLSGLIWKNISPIYIFLIPVAVDLFLKIPLLTTVPETLHRER